MVDSDSSLSSAPSTDDEMAMDVAPAKATKAAPQQKKKKSKKNSTILTFFKKKSPSPPSRTRPASPAHEYVAADNPDIAFVVMFRSRFNDAFPRGSPHVGPQDIEQGVVDEKPSSDVEGLLCTLLGLVLNRKKPVEKGHYGRALEEAVQTQRSQWPRKWNYMNPLSGGRNFNTMSAEERITLLHTLTLWSLNQNEQVKAILADAYKHRTTKDRLDTNIPLSVQPWGRDGDKRRYWLVEGQNDTHFRVYRETDPHLKKATWWSVAGTIEELQALAKKLEEEDGTKEAKALGERMLNAVPRFEASENKRKRREYRVNRNAAFTRPDPGFSLYEGRTRGKRLRYTFSDGEDFDSDNTSSRRSARNSGRETSIVPAGPTVTASGRQVRSRATGLYGETLLSGQVTDNGSPATGDYVRSDVSEEPAQPAHGRSTRAATNGRPLNRVVDSDDEDDATSWDGGDEDEDELEQMDVDDEEEEVSKEEDGDSQTLVVTLRYGKGRPSPIPVEDTVMKEEEAPPIQTTNTDPLETPAQAMNAVSNGVVEQRSAVVAQNPPQPVTTETLPKLEGFFPASAPAYSASEEPRTKTQQGFTASVPVPAPAAGWL